MDENLFGGDGPRILVGGGPHSPAELRAMELDGVLRRVLPGAYVPARHADSPTLRAAAAAALAGQRLRGGAVGRLTAAWVYGCAPVPGELEVLVPRFHRSAMARDPLRVCVSESRLLPGEVRSIGGVAVTTPARTALDVAFHSPEDRAVPALTRLVNAPGLGCPRGHLLRLVEETARRPGKLRAERLVRGLLTTVAA
jgi:hypothetical protein